MTEKGSPSRSEGWNRSYDGDPWRTGGALHDHESAYDLLIDLIQGGFAQIALFALPALWVVARIPVYTDEMAAAAVVVAWTTLLLTAFRGG